MLLCNSVDDLTQSKKKLVKEIIPDSLRLGDLSNAPRPLQMNNKATKGQTKQVLFLLIVQFVVFAHLRLKRIQSAKPVNLNQNKIIIPHSCFCSEHDSTPCPSKILTQFHALPMLPN